MLWDIVEFLLFAHLARTCSLRAPVSGHGQMLAVQVCALRMEAYKVLRGLGRGRLARQGEARAACTGV